MSLELIDTVFSDYCKTIRKPDMKYNVEHMDMDNVKDDVSINRLQFSKPIAGCVIDMSLDDYIKKCKNNDKSARSASKRASKMNRKSSLDFCRCNLLESEMENQKLYITIKTLGTSLYLLLLFQFIILFIVFNYIFS